MTNINEATSHDISRRAITKTAAWATPAIALAVAAPNASASGTSTCTETDLQPVFGTAINFDLAGDATALIRDLEAWFDTLNLGILGLPIKLAFDALVLAINTVGDNVVNVKLSLPDVLQIINNGPLALGGDNCPPVTGEIEWNTDLFSIEDTIIGANLIQTNNGVTTYTVPVQSETPVGGVVAELPLRYNPLAVSLNTGSQHTTQYTSTATITSLDLVGGNNVAVVPVGLDITVAHIVSEALQALKNLIGLPEFFIRIPILSSTN